MISAKQSSVPLSRKEFLKKFSGLLLIPLPLFWINSIAKRAEAGRKFQMIRISANIREGISFTDEVIIVKNENRLKLFSAKCTHLGCLINKSENNEFICQCHGSRFSIEGRVLKGPASQPLKQYSYKIEPGSNEITINAVE